MKKLTIGYKKQKSLSTSVYDAQVEDNRIYISGRAYEGITDIYSLSLEYMETVSLDGKVLYSQGV